VPHRRSVWGRLYHGETSIDFYGRRWIGLGFSAVLLLISIGSLVGQGLNLSLDFKGGVVWTVPSATMTEDDARAVLNDAGLEGSVVALVGDSPTVGRHWTTPLALLFIDGGHGSEPAHRDFETWTPHVEPGGLLVIHDVFPDPADGGRPPYEIYLRALESGEFVEERAVGSLRVLRRVA